jgi:hypothetical protein
VLFGGALLALSNFSLKIWKEGKSSLRFILGQAGSDLSMTRDILSHEICFFIVRI